MVEKIKKFYFEKLGRERAAILGVVILGVMVSLWLATPGASNPDQPFDLSLVIPKGFLVIPIELANAKSLAALVNQNGVVDVFRAGDRRQRAHGDEENNRVFAVGSDAEQGQRRRLTRRIVV